MIALPLASPASPEATTAATEAAYAAPVSVVAALPPAATALPLAADAPTGLVVRGHVPTLWSIFTRAVRLRLQAELGPQWSLSTEWRVLMALHDEASAAPGMRWQLPGAARQETVVGKVVPKGPKPFRQQRRPSASRGPRREPEKVGAAGV